MSTKPAIFKNPLRYIQRIDDKHHSWKVALRRKNEEIHKYFTDTVYGGTARALAAAIAWRDEVQAHYATADYAIWRRERVPPTNTTGLVGVYRGGNAKKKEWPLEEVLLLARVLDTR